MTELQINEARSGYRHPPSVAARLWFVVADLVSLHPMYTTSLATFTAMFGHCIRTAPAAATLEGRMDGLVSCMYAYVHKMVSRGLMHAHKLVFGFVMAAAGQRERGEVSQQEWDALVSASAAVSTVGVASSGSRSPVTNSSSSSGAAAPPTAPAWCKPAVWQGLARLETLCPANFQGLCVVLAAQQPSNNGNSSSSSSWQHLLLHGSLDNFMGVGEAEAGAGRARQDGGGDSSCCLLQQLLAAASVGARHHQQQRQQQPEEIGSVIVDTAEAVSGGSSVVSRVQSLGLFSRLLLIKVSHAVFVVLDSITECALGVGQLAEHVDMHTPTHAHVPTNRPTLVCTAASAVLSVCAPDSHPRPAERTCCQLPCTDLCPPPSAPPLPTRQPPNCPTFLPTAALSRRSS